MQARLKKLARAMWDARYIYLLLIPGIVYFAVFHYGPMNGVILAFKKYNARLGIWGSKWVGWDNFARIFRTPAAMEAIRNTFEINISRLLFQFPAPILLALLISIPLGILAAIKHNSIWDSLATFLATIGTSLPKFWFGLVLIIFFAQKLHWLPSTGIAYPSEDGWIEFFRHLILPAFSLALGLAATQTRMIRSSMLDTLGQDYVRFARSKGLRERTVIMGHALKNAMIPVVTVIGSEFGSLLGGAVVTETIFSWPGVGRLIMNSISKRDYPMIQGTTLVMCTLFLLINLLVDIICAWLNPKIRLDKK